MCKKNNDKKDQLLRAPRVGKHNSTRVDEGRKTRNILAIKMQGTNRSGERGRRAGYRCDPRAELRLGEREEEQGEDNNGV